MKNINPNELVTLQDIETGFYECGNGNYRAFYVGFAMQVWKWTKSEKWNALYLKLRQACLDSGWSEERIVRDGEYGKIIAQQYLRNHKDLWQGPQVVKPESQVPTPDESMPLEPLQAFNKGHASLVWDLFHQSGHLLEMRVMGKWMKDGIPIKSMFSGIYDDDGKTAFIRDVQRLDKKVPSEITNIYITMNPVSNEQFSQVTNARNRLYGKKDIIGNEKSTNDDMIVDRRWLLLDFDPSRPQGTNATNDEKLIAWQRVKTVGGFLRQTFGWEPSVVASSGNGYHLLYRVSLAAHDDRISKMLHALHAKFSDKDVMIDRTVSNEARITKCYGTMTAKGDDTPERPRRRSQMLKTHTPANGILTAEDFDRAFSHEELSPFFKEIVTPTVEQQKKYAGPRLINSLDDLEKWVIGHGLTVHEIVGNSLKIECPWEADHSTHDHGTSVFFNDDHSLGFNCFHGHCTDRKWHDVRKKLEPNYDGQGTIELEAWLSIYPEPSEEEYLACLKKFPELLNDPRPAIDAVKAIKQFSPNAVLWILASNPNILHQNVVKLIKWALRKVA